MTSFFGAKTCSKELQVKVRMNHYSMTTMRIIRTRSGKLQLCTSGWQSTTWMSMTTCMHAWHSTTRNVNDNICGISQMHTCNHILWAPCTVLWQFSHFDFIHTHAPWLKMFAPFTPSTWSSTCVCSPRLDFPSLPPPLLSAIFLLLYLPEVHGKLAQLC